MAEEPKTPSKLSKLTEGAKKFSKDFGKAVLNDAFPGMSGIINDLKKYQSSSGKSFEEEQAERKGNTSALYYSVSRANKGIIESNEILIGLLQVKTQQNAILSSILQELESRPMTGSGFFGDDDGPLMPDKTPEQLEKERKAAREKYRKKMEKKAARRKARERYKTIAKEQFKKGLGKSKAGAKVAKDVIKEAVKKTLSKSFTKTILKKIPAVSILAGLGYGAWRLFEGDKTGAAGEVFSGVVGTFAGPGTAASIATDIVMTTRDVYFEVYGMFPEDDPDQASRFGDVKNAVEEWVKESFSSQTQAPETKPGATQTSPVENLSETSKDQKQDSVVRKAKQHNRIEYVTKDLSFEAREILFEANRLKILKDRDSSIGTGGRRGGSGSGLFDTDDTSSSSSGGPYRGSSGVTPEDIEGSSEDTYTPPPPPPPPTPTSYGGAANIPAMSGTPGGGAPPSLSERNAASSSEGTPIEGGEKRKLADIVQSNPEMVNIPNLNKNIELSGYYYKKKLLEGMKFDASAFDPTNMGQRIIDLQKPFVGKSAWGGEGQKLITQYLREGGINMNTSQDAYCMAWVNATLRKLGYTGSSGMLARQGGEVGPAVQYKDLKPGDVVYNMRHTGFFYGWIKGEPYMISGNAGGGRVEIQPMPKNWYNYARPTHRILKFLPKDQLEALKNQLSPGTTGVPLTSSTTVTPPTSPDFSEKGQLGGTERVKKDGLKIEDDSKKADPNSLKPIDVPVLPPEEEKKSDIMPNDGLTRLAANYMSDTMTMTDVPLFHIPNQEEDDVKQRSGQAVDIISQYLGKNETNPEDRKALMDYLSGSGEKLNPEKQAWCAATIASAYNQVGLQPPKGYDNINEAKYAVQAGRYRNWGQRIDDYRQFRKGDIVTNTKQSPRTGLIGSHVEAISRGPYFDKSKEFTPDWDESKSARPASGMMYMSKEEQQKINSGWFVDMIGGNNPIPGDTSGEGRIVSEHQVSLSEFLQGNLNVNRATPDQLIDRENIPIASNNMKTIPDTGTVNEVMESRKNWIKTKKLAASVRKKIEKQKRKNKNSKEKNPIKKTSDNTHSQNDYTNVADTSSQILMKSAAESLNGDQRTTGTLV